MKFVIILILTLFVQISIAQDTPLPDELYGFRLGQYKTTVLNELGKPDQKLLLQDSTAVDYYYITKDSSTYVSFQYTPLISDEIYAIQLSGLNSSRLFYGIQLGSSENNIITKFGKPDTLINQEFEGARAEIWKYSNKNLSFLLKEKKIKSIRIWDDNRQKHANYPTFKEILKTITAKNKETICDILSPNLEIFHCDNVLPWKNSIYKDVNLEKASVFDFITNHQYGLASLANRKKISPELNLRVIEGAGTFPVYKLPNDELISEVVLNYQQGRYKIWEIKYKCQ